MRFTPVTEEDAAGCLPKGEYDAVVAKATEKRSQAGNDMIELDLTVYGEFGTEVSVRDWILAGEKGARKLQGFCKCAGLWDTYLAGELTPDSCLNRNLVVGIKIEDGDFGPQNRVSYYKHSKPQEPEESKAGQGVSPQQRNAAGTGRADPTKPPTGDEIPF